MADQFHLVERVVDGHRRRRMVLDAHDPTGHVIVHGFQAGLRAHLSAGVRRGRIERIGQVETFRGRHGGGLMQRDRGLVAVMHLAAVLAAPHPAFELVHRGLKGAVEAVRAPLPAHHRTATVRSDLDVLAVLALPTVLLVFQLHVEATDRTVDPFDAGQLLPHVDAVVVGHLDVAASHLDVRIDRLALRGGLAVEFGVHGLR